MSSRNPFQGGVGFSTLAIPKVPVKLPFVAIPFRVGWGFQHVLAAYGEAVTVWDVAIPFRVGWGFQRER